MIRDQNCFSLPGLTYTSRPNYIPHQILDAHLVPSLLIIVKPVALGEIHAVKLGI